MRSEAWGIYRLVKKYGGVLSDDRHFVDDVMKLLEQSNIMNKHRKLKESLKEII